MDIQNVKYFLELIQKENDGNHIDYVVPGYAGRPIVGYQSMRQDLVLCVEAANRFGQFVDDEIMSLCILHTIVILYGKCFTESQKYPNLDANKCFQGEHENFRQFHNELMELRHNLSAHRGITEYDVGFPYLKLNVEDLSRQVRVRQLKRRRPPADRIIQYVGLFEYLIQFVEARFKDAAEKVWSHLLKNFSAEELSHLKIAGPTRDIPRPEGG